MFKCSNNVQVFRYKSIKYSIIKTFRNSNYSMTQIYSEIQMKNIQTQNIIKIKHSIMKMLKYSNIENILYFNIEILNIQIFNHWKPSHT